MNHGDLIRLMNNKQLAQFIYITVKEEIELLNAVGYIRNLESWEKFLDLNCEGFNNIL